MSDFLLNRSRDDLFNGQNMSIRSTSCLGNTSVAGRSFKHGNLNQADAFKVRAQLRRNALSVTLAV